ncbi:Putative pentatricopeptide repeat-containing protein At3g18840 [Linum perenne]
MWSRLDEMGIDEVTLTIMINLCAKSSMLCVGTQLHCHMVKTANDVSGFAANSLIGMYSKCGCFEEACETFEGCQADVDSVTKHSLLAACCRIGEMVMAASVFQTASELNHTISWNTMIWGYLQKGCVGCPYFCYSVDCLLSLEEIEYWEGSPCFRVQPEYFLVDLVTLYWYFYLSF